MSDEQVAAPEVATPEAPTEAPSAPAAPGEAKANARQRARQRAEQFVSSRTQAAAARERAQAQPRVEAGAPEGGQFKAGDVPVDAGADPPIQDEEVAAEAASPEATEAPAEPQDGAAKPEAVSGPPDGWVRIEYPEGHPLTAQGKKYIDVPADQERDVRTLVNASARRQEADEAMRLLEEERRQRLRLEAEVKFDRERGSEFWTPENQQKYDDILQTYGEEDAERYRRGVLADMDSERAKVRDEADMQALKQHWQTQGANFRSAAYAALPMRFPGLTQSEIDRGLALYETELVKVEQKAWENSRHLGLSELDFKRQFTKAMGGYNLDDLIAVAGPYFKGIAADRGSQNGAASEVERAKIRAEVEAEERRKLEEAAARSATNPHRALGAAETGRRTTDTDAPDEDWTKQGSTQVRRTAKERMHAKIAARLGQRA